MALYSHKNNMVYYRNKRRYTIFAYTTASYNLRKTLKPGDREFEKIKSSITGFEYVDPVIVNPRHDGRVRRK
jgi:hypothetical protein